MNGVRTRIANVAKISSGKRPPLIEKEKTAQCVVPVIGGGGPSGFTLEANESAGVLITGRVGTLGKLHVAAEACWPSDNALIIKPVSDEIDRSFLRYALSEVIASATELNRGAANPLLTQKDLGQLEIAFFPFPEQREIAAILGALDDKIEVNRKASATLEEMARALYRSWFVDFDPVWAKLEGRQPAHVDAATAALFPDSFGDGGLPVGWRSVPVGELLTLNYGKALKKELRIAGEYPVYGSGGSDTSHEQALVQQPTIIVGRKGTVGSLYWEPRGCWPIDTVFYVTSDLPLPYIYRMLQELPLAHMNTDAAVPGLNRDNAYRLKVAFPGSQLIAAYEQTAGAFQARIDSLENESRTLAMLRDTLLPRLMSGELRVGEARELVEEVA